MYYYDYVNVVSLASVLNIRMVKRIQIEIRFDQVFSTLYAMLSLTLTLTYA